MTPKCLQPSSRPLAKLGINLPTLASPASPCPSSRVCSTPWVSQARPRILPRKRRKKDKKEKPKKEQWGWLKSKFHWGSSDDEDDDEPEDKDIDKKVAQLDDNNADGKEQQNRFLLILRMLLSRMRKLKNLRAEVDQIQDPDKKAKALKELQAELDSVNDLTAKLQAKLGKDKLAKQFDPEMLATINQSIASVREQSADLGKPGFSMPKVKMPSFRKKNIKEKPIKEQWGWLKSKFQWGDSDDEDEDDEPEEKDLGKRVAQLDDGSPDNNEQQNRLMFIFRNLFSRLRRLKKLRLDIDQIQDPDKKAKAMKELQAELDNVNDLTAKLQGKIGKDKVAKQFDPQMLATINQTIGKIREQSADLGKPGFSIPKVKIPTLKQKNIKEKPLKDQWGWLKLKFQWGDSDDEDEDEPEDKDLGKKVSQLDDGNPDSNEQQNRLMFIFRKLLARLKRLKKMRVEIDKIQDPDKKAKAMKELQFELDSVNDLTAKLQAKIGKDKVAKQFDPQMLATINETIGKIKNQSADLGRPGFSFPTVKIPTLKKRNIKEKPLKDQWGWLKSKFQWGDSDDEDEDDDPEEKDLEKRVAQLDDGSPDSNEQQNRLMFIFRNLLARMRRLKKWRLEIDNIQDPDKKAKALKELQVELDNVNDLTAKLQGKIGKDKVAKQFDPQMLATINQTLGKIKDQSADLGKPGFSMPKVKFPTLKKKNIKEKPLKEQWGWLKSKFQWGDSDDEDDDEPEEKDLDKKVSQLDDGSPDSNEQQSRLMFIFRNLLARLRRLKKWRLEIDNIQDPDKKAKALKELQVELDSVNDLTAKLQGKIGKDKVAKQFDPQMLATIIQTLGKIRDQSADLGKPGFSMPKFKGVQYTMGEPSKAKDTPKEKKKKGQEGKAKEGTMGLAEIQVPLGFF